MNTSGLGGFQLLVHRRWACVVDFPPAGARSPLGKPPHRHTPTGTSATLTLDSDAGLNPNPRRRNRYENEGFHQPEDQQAPEEINQCLRVEDTTGLCYKLQRPLTATRQADRCYPLPETNIGRVDIFRMCVSASFWGGGG